MMTEDRRMIRIDGAGPAGSAAAIAARQAGAEVRIVEKSRGPRHKVCGEFITAEACEVLQELGAQDELSRLNPAFVDRCRLHFGARVKEWKLGRPAMGLSRLDLDRLLLDRASSLGAIVERGDPGEQGGPRDGAIILANGRTGIASK